MIEEPWKLVELDPGEKLDRRVRRRMRTLTEPRLPAQRAAPFLPLERAIYFVVVAVYALYAGARTVQVLKEARAPGILTPVASIDDATCATAQPGRAPRRA